MCMYCELVSFVPVNHCNSSKEARFTIVWGARKTLIVHECTNKAHYEILERELHKRYNSWLYVARELWSTAPPQWLVCACGIFPPIPEGSSSHVLGTGKQTPTKQRGGLHKREPFLCCPQGKFIDINVTNFHEYNFRNVQSINSYP